MPLYLCSSLCMFSLLWSTSPFPTPLFLSDPPNLTLSEFLSQAWGRQSMSMRAAVHQLMMHSNIPSSVKQELMAPACTIYVRAYCCLALDSIITITTVGKQDTLETLVTCCLLCVSAGPLRTQLHGVALMPVYIYISRRGNCSACMCSVLPARHLEGI